MVTRKNFIHLASMSIGSLVVPGILLSNSSPGTTQKQSPMQALAQQALNNARAGGASYADVRISSRPKLSISTRVLVNGAWGFASTAALSTEAVDQCVQNALNCAVDNKHAKRYKYDLETPHDVWMCAFMRK